MVTTTTRNFTTEHWTWNYNNSNSIRATRRQKAIFVIRLFGSRCLLFTNAKMAAKVPHLNWITLSKMHVVVLKAHGVWASQKKKTRTHPHHGFFDKLNGLLVFRFIFIYNIYILRPSIRTQTNASTRTPRTPSIPRTRRYRSIAFASEGNLPRRNGNTN